MKPKELIEDLQNRQALKYVQNRKDAKKLWLDFGNTPIDDFGFILEDWHIFRKGDHREDIWRWFEEKFNVSIVKDLMQCGEI